MDYFGIYSAKLRSEVKNTELDDQNNRSNSVQVGSQILIEKANIILKAKDGSIQNTDLIPEDNYENGGKDKSSCVNFLRKGQGSVTRSESFELKPSIIEPEMLIRQSP